MKKLFLTILFTLVLSGGASAEKIIYSSNDLIIVEISSNQDAHLSNIFGSDWDTVDYQYIKVPSIAENYCKNLNYKTYLLGQAALGFKLNEPTQWKVNLDMDGGTTALGLYKNPYKIRYYCAKNKNDAFKKFRQNIDVKKFGNVKFKSWLIKNGENIYNDNNMVWLTNDKDTYTFWAMKRNEKEQKEQDSIMFTIKDKREQCEAIGFKPETDKFADCVLRLVELDVKKQQDQKIASAKSSGNLAVANQLQQMRNDNSSRYLMDLGQQLLKPKQYNSNIYMPQTQRCTIQGFGSFANMVCR
jgi:hypothetical protein